MTRSFSHVSWVRGPRGSGVLGTVLALAAAIGACKPAPPAPPLEPGPSAPLVAREPTEAPARSEPAAAIDLPLRQLDTMHIVVPVAFGDRPPMDFILDTGASVSVITPATRDALGLDPGDGQKAKGAGAGGKLGDVRVLVLDGLRVGDQTYDKHMVAVMELGHLEEKLQTSFGGVLGRNFLERHILDLDFELRRLRMNPAELDAPVEPGLIPVPFTAFDRGGLIKVEVRLDGAEAMPAMLDLGAGRSVINWKAAEAAGVGRNHDGLEPSPEPLLGADNKPIEAAYYRFGELALGPVSFGHPELFMADLPVFGTLGIEKGPAMVFGVDMFRGRRLVVDYPRQRLLISGAGG